MLEGNSPWADYERGIDGERTMVDYQPEQREQQVDTILQPNRPGSIIEIPGLVIVRKLGQGGMATTYLAHIKGNKNKLVAIKIERLDLESNGYLHKEAEVLQQLTHRSIIRIIPIPGIEDRWISDVQIDGHKFKYILLEYMPKKSLEEKINQAKGNLLTREKDSELSYSNILNLMEQISEALDYAHEQDIVHLDIKPSNILFSLSGQRVVLSDFGIAQTKENDGKKETIKELIGTPTYAAPEQLDGDPVNHRADIYSLGVVLAEMLQGETLSGKTTVDSPNLSSIIKHNRLTDDFLQDLPRRLRRIVLKATHPDPKKRYSTTKALVKDLRKARFYVTLRIRLAKMMPRCVRPVFFGGGALILVANLMYLLWFLATIGYPWAQDLTPWFFRLTQNSSWLTLIILCILSVAWGISYENSWVEKLEIKLSSKLGSKSSSTGQFPTPYTPPASAPGGKTLTGSGGWEKTSDKTTISGWETQPNPAVSTIGHTSLPEPSPFIRTTPVKLPHEALNKIADYNPLASIVIREGLKEGAKYWLTSKQTKLGRDKDNDIVLEDISASSKHAVIVYQEDKFSIYDLGSMNGTTVNSKRVKDRALQNDDHIIIGGTLLHFQYTHKYTVLQNFNSAWEIYATNASVNAKIAGDDIVKKLTNYLSNAMDITTSGQVVDLQWCYAFTLDTSIVFAETNLPAQLPIVYSNERIPIWDDIEQLRQSLNDYIGSVILMVLPVENVPKDDLRSLSRTSRSRSWDLVFIGHQDFKDIILSQNPRRALRKVILSQIQLRSTLSPFVENGPTTTLMFFGREREIRDVVEKVDGASFAITGARRIGKTSMLMQLHNNYLPKEGFRTVYNDCSTFHSSSDFFQAPVDVWQPSPPANTPSTFGDLLESVPTDRLLVLLLDEMGELVYADRQDSWNLFKRFRKLATHGQIKFVFGGGKTLHDAVRDAESPLFNFANEIRLGCLSPIAVNELITRSMTQLEIELVNEVDIINEIYEFTSGHPNIVQRLCRRLIDKIGERDNREIRLEDVTAIIKDPQFQRDDFLDTYWGAATLIEKIISLMMVDSPGLHTLSTLQQAWSERFGFSPKIQKIDEALDSLVYLRNILNHTPNGYDLAVQAFPKVIDGTMTLDDTLPVLVAEYQQRMEETVI